MKKKTETKDTKQKQESELARKEENHDPVPAQTTPEAQREPTTEEVLAWVVKTQDETGKKIAELAQTLASFKNTLEAHDSFLSRMTTQPSEAPGGPQAKGPLDGLLGDPKAIEQLGKFLSGILKWLGSDSEKKEDKDEKKLTNQIVQQSLRRLTAQADREELRNQAIREGLEELG